MATRSTIALEFADGTVQQVYCHWDGYLDNNGRLLQEYYSDPFKLQRLIDLGDLSTLCPEVDAGNDSHTFSQPKAGVCIFYGRDRGETGTSAKKFKDYADYVANHQYEEYEYILRTDGNWYVSKHDGPYALLKNAIIELDMKEAA